MSTAAKCFKSTPPLHILRGLLRHARHLPSFNADEAVVTTSSQVKTEEKMSPRAYLISQYRQSLSCDRSSLKADRQRRLAYDYFHLLSNIKERGRLHELDGGAETKLSPKEFTRRAAARAGFHLPDEV